MDDFSFSRPIPGQSLTAELGARPWQTPPQFTTVDDALGYYLPRMAQKKFAKGLVDVMETGVPLTNLANVIMLSGVMEGKHSVDVGILTIPAIIETMKLIGDSAGVEYTTGMEEPEGVVDDNKLRMVAAKRASQEENIQEESNPLALDQVEQVTEEPKGLMSRRDVNVQ
tara:strand:+ start:513 stop:1019 length:507 start_codon:yes stop_codon:yes gene_type:complete